MQIFALLIIYLRFTYMITYEKEKRVTENMRNMGMGMLSHYFSWLTFYLGVLFVSSLVWTFLLSITFFS